MGELVQLGTRRSTDAVLEMDRHRREHGPTVYWYLSFFCNLACKHCWVNSSPWVDTSNDLDTETALRVVEQMAELRVHNAILTGGEVLTRRDIEIIVRALADHGVRAILETNALLINDARVALFKELQGRGLLGLSISVDGGTKEAHEWQRGPRTFKRTIDRLDLLAANGIEFSVQAVLNRRSYETIPQLFELARRWAPHLEYLAFVPVNPIGRGEEVVQEVGLGFADYGKIFDLIRKGLEDFEATAVIKTPPATVPPQYLDLVFRHPKVKTQMSCDFPLLGVLPNGNVTVCALSREDDGLFFGNVKENTLGELWHKVRMDALRHRYLAAESLDGICGECVFRKRCKGGCRAWAYEEGGSFDAPMPICAELERQGQFPQIYRTPRWEEVFASAVPVGCSGCS